MLRIHSIKIYPLIHKFSYHFHPDYFGKGYRWHDPRTDRMERAFIRAREAFEADGRKVYNATVGGKLEVYERVAYASLFDDREIETPSDRIKEPRR